MSFLFPRDTEVENTTSQTQLGAKALNINPFLMESAKGYAWSSPLETATFELSATAPSERKIKYALIAFLSTLIAGTLGLMAYRARFAVRYSFGQSWALLNGECDYRIAIIQAMNGAELLFERDKEATASVIQISAIQDMVVFLN